MSSNETGALYSPTGNATEILSMGVNLDDLVRITFLEQSARYFGVYINKDLSDSTINDHNWIN